jgi:hypothetical protein
MMSILGLISVACIVKIILKSWQWGVLAAAILSSIPLWTGHAMINIKDTPVAVGVSVFVLGLIVLVQEDFFQKKKLLWVGIVSLVAGSVLAIGTRIGIWPFLAAFTMFAIGADTLMRRYRFGLTGLNGFDFKKICVCVVTQCLAYLLLLIIYPKIFSSPVRMVWFSVKSSSKYDWPGMSLTAGVFHSQPPPFWYAPAWLTHQIPVLILLLALLGVVLSIRHLAGRHKYVFLKINYQVIARNSGITTASVGIVLMFALFALFAVIAVKANLYGGIRHLLFIIPAWAILATLGYWFVLQFAVNVSHSKKCLVFLSNTTCVLALLLPTLDQSRLFPYNLIYFNEIATLRAIKNRWPSDSWYTSSKELALNLNSKEEVYCFDYARGMPLLEKNQVLKSSLVKNCNLAYLKPYLKPNSMREETVQPSSESILLVAPEAIGGRISAFCQLHSQVTRPLRSQTLVISDAHLCAADSLKLQ